MYNLAFTEGLAMFALQLLPSMFCAACPLCNLSVQTRLHSPHISNASYLLELVSSPLTGWAVQR